MKGIGNIFCLMSLFVMSIGCNDDDEGRRYPNMRTELVEAQTNSEANVSFVRLDDGSEYVPMHTISTTTSDTIFRCVCSFEDNGDGTARIYTLQRIPSSFPKPAAQFETTESAPLKVISRWESSRYINAYISYKTSGQGNHKFQFCEDGIIDESGVPTAHVRMIHTSPPEDAASYSSYIYVSFPKYYYDGKASVVNLTIE